jgi:murein DD-endopeptidase MepM/ murein hydrolase activator NlpD
MEKEPRRMTFIVVPHGGRDLSTRSFEVSYRRLRAAGIVVAVLSVVWIGMALSWAYMASQAVRVPGLQRDLARFEEERGQVQELALALHRLEGQYTQVRELLGANRSSDPSSIWLPPLGAAASTVAAEHEGGDAQIPSAWPLTQRGFVTREHLGRIPGQHPGIDIAVAEGSYVRAAGGGVVTEAGEDAVYGRFVKIRHADGYESVYGHAAELYVTASDEVTRHQVIALSGNTGTSTAPHLHFEVWKDGEPIDPRELVESP